MESRAHQIGNLTNLHRFRFLRLPLPLSSIFGTPHDLLGWTEDMANIQWLDLLLLVSSVDDLRLFTDLDQFRWMCGMSTLTRAEHPFSLQRYGPRAREPLTRGSWPTLVDLDAQSPSCDQYYPINSGDVSRILILTI